MKSSQWLLTASFLASSFALAACGDDSGPTDGNPGGDGEFVLPADPMNVRRCPELADNEQMVMAEGFLNEANQALYSGRFKHEKSYGRDVVGNEDVTQELEGRYQRGASALPENFTGVSGERVQFFLEEDGQWVNVGSSMTGAAGDYTFEIPAEHQFGVGNHRVLAILEATGTCNEHGVFVWPAETQSMITDIDGTMTSTDAEFIRQLSDVNYVPEQNINASTMMQAWEAKGYASIYLTARPNEFRWLSRIWLREQGFPYGPMETAETFVAGATAREYKGAFVRYLNDLQIDLVAAYGNAESDVQAYDDGGIPLDITFTINEAAGMNGTIAVPNGDWTSHISEFVSGMPTVDNGF